MINNNRRDRENISFLLLKEYLHLHRKKIASVNIFSRTKIKDIYVHMFSIIMIHDRSIKIQKSKNNSQTIMPFRE